MKNGSMSRWIKDRSASATRVLAVVVFSLSAIGCRTGHASLADPAAAPRAEWSAALAQVAVDAGAGRYPAADRALSEYATRYPASAGAVESIYWRALYRMDPANQAASARDASALLESYIAAPAAERRAEATALRRVAMALEARGAASSPSANADASKPADKGKDEELARVKDELAKANAELERIRRRLATPKP